MHTLNLGIYHYVNAEGLIMLSQHRAAMWHCTFDEALQHLYWDFRAWCNAQRVSCSHRCWKRSHLHMHDPQLGIRTFPWMNSKAYNARVILAWLSVFRQWIYFFRGNFAK